MTPVKLSCIYWKIVFQVPSELWSSWRNQSFSCACLSDQVFLENGQKSVPWQSGLLHIKYSTAENGLSKPPVTCHQCRCWAKQSLGPRTLSANVWCFTHMGVVLCVFPCTSERCTTFIFFFTNFKFKLVLKWKRPTNTSYSDIKWKRPTNTSYSSKECRFSKLSFLVHREKHKLQVSLPKIELNILLKHLYHTTLWARSLGSQGVLWGLGETPLLVDQACFGGTFQVALTARSVCLPRLCFVWQIRGSFHFWCALHVDLAC